MGIVNYRPFLTEPNKSEAVPPATVTNLAIFTLTGNNVTLKWTAPGDDGNVGTAAQYDIRYSTSEITDANWDAATPCKDVPKPQPAGSEETFKVTGLSPFTIYYFALKTADEVPNWSDLSNVVVGKTTAKTGDVSGNGTVSAYDAALILQYVVGLIDDFPADSMSSPFAISPRSYVVSIPELSVKAGDRIHVPIAIDDATGLLTGGISLRYDSTVLKAVDVLTNTLLNGSYWKSNITLDGEVRFAFATTEPTKGQGNLLMVEFEVLPNTEGKTSNLILDNISLSNSLTITKINGSVTVIPATFSLLQNYPNPFNPDTWLPFKLAQNAPVSINIYDTKGQLIRAIALGNKNAGVYVTKDKAAYWDGRDNFGEKVSSGVYFYTLQAGEFRATRKMVIVK
ncbi:T9SS type A sorting domain-containing protein [Candidatus Poribacteria bacterium]|nr:T9SS type A sorting domain-containing protein [Candidatus Poribacteria bacterium]